MKIAIIGTGISGLGAAHLLNRVHDIEMFEANDYIGGHTNTITVDDNGSPLNVDTGFIVYNDATYPNLIRLFDELGVATQPSDMSFSVSCRQTDFEFGSRRYRDLFARKRNLISPTFWRMIKDYIRFQQEAHKDKDNPRYENYTLGDYIEEKQFNDDYVRYQLLPMTSAIWSSPQMSARDFPLHYLIGFYVNHGVIGNRPVQWRTVVGGSKNYVTKLTEPFRHKIHLNTPIQAVKRFADHVQLTLSDGSHRIFDEVVIATHTDQALQLLADASEEERIIFNKIPYQKNTAVLHTDESLMPRRRGAWASWNYVLGKGYKTEQPASLTYYMNSLQSLQTNTNYFVTINPIETIRPEHIIKTIQYAHPCYTMDTLDAQRRLAVINGQNRTHFCGAYCGYGFHEDGIASGLAVANKLGVTWDTPPIKKESDKPYEVIHSNGQADALPAYTR